MKTNIADAIIRPQTDVKEAVPSFYNYLPLEEYTFIDPVALLRQKSRFVQKSQG